MALDIAIVKNPFDEHSDEENFNSGLWIEIDEWGKLFEIVLQAPVEIKRLELENRADFLNRREKLFQEDLASKGYKMLGRIWYYFQDVFYEYSEVNILLEECLNVQQNTLNKSALSFLDKLIFACNEALRVKSGIMLVSD